MTSFLEILLLASAIYLAFKSPRKWRTAGRMMVAFLTVLLLSIIGSVFLRIGDPEVWGAVGRVAGLLAAVIAGLRHVRSLTLAKSEPLEQPRPDDQTESL